MLHKQLAEFGKVKTNEPMSKHTTFKIGGSAEHFIIVEETEKLIELLKFLDGEGIPHFILGGGSNMLVGDEGFAGVVVQIKNQKYVIPPTKVGRIQKEFYIEADAGCVTVAIAQLSMQNNLTGFEWGVGVPGTIGGAVRGNAGAMGGEMKDSVESVTVYRDGEVVTLTNEECKFGYRDSLFKHNNDIILSVVLSLEKTEDKEMMKKALEYLQYRNKTQPQGFASTGCIFQNVVIPNSESSSGEESHSKLKTNLISKFPEDTEKIEKFFQIGKISAGWLVEKSGMKGVQVGKAQVSERHGNFVVNLGGAMAADVLTLIEQIKEKVYTKIGVEIEEEIQII